MTSEGVKHKISVILSKAVLKWGSLRTPGTCVYGAERRTQSHPYGYIIEEEELV